MHSLRTEKVRAGVFFGASRPTPGAPTPASRWPATRWRISDFRHDSCFKTGAQEEEMRPEDDATVSVRGIEQAL